MHGCMYVPQLHASAWSRIVFLWTEFGGLNKLATKNVSYMYMWYLFVCIFLRIASNYLFIYIYFKKVSMRVRCM